jgi:hypothetical protein
VVQSITAHKLSLIVAFQLHDNANAKGEWSRIKSLIQHHKGKMSAGNGFFHNLHSVAANKLKCE